MRKKADLQQIEANIETINERVIKPMYENSEFGLSLADAVTAAIYDQVSTKPVKVCENYAWDFNPEAEIWDNDTHETVEDCIEEARAVVANDEHGYSEPPTVIYVGKTKAYSPSIGLGAVENILDGLKDDAWDDYGEIGSDWEPYDNKKLDELEELRSGVERVIFEWLKKHNRYPQFYSIDNIKEYSLETENEI